MKIKSITRAGIEPVYNMTVDEHHNYIIRGGIILKNCDALRYFAISRILYKEDKAPVRDREEDDRNEEDYDEAMTGGDLDMSYLGI